MGDDLKSAAPQNCFHLCRSNKLSFSPSPRSKWFQWQQGLRQRFEILARQQHIQVLGAGAVWGNKQIGEGPRRAGFPYKAKGFVHVANALRKAKGMTRGEEGWLIGN